MPARLTPYELILEPLESEEFPAIRAEGEQRGSDVHRRDQFLLLGHAGAANIQSPRSYSGSVSSVVTVLSSE